MLNYSLIRLPIATNTQAHGGRVMSLQRWQPWSEIATLQRQFDQMFNQVAGAVDVAAPVGHPPAIELSTTDTAVVLKVELPGLDRENIDLQVTADAIVLKGEYSTAATDTHHQIHCTELRRGAFQRVIPLPVRVDYAQATATFNQGLLTLTVPRPVAPESAVHKVTITAADPIAVNPVPTGDLW
jgi:HSP20 family protein